MTAKRGKIRPKKHGASPNVSVAEAVESIVRCKWSLQVLAQIRRGVNRPGAIERACAGLSTKVLNERLTKMRRFGILRRVAFRRIPPHVEYHLTPLGERFVAILDAIEALQSDLRSAAGPARPARVR